jgi:hypothetical protein
MIPNTPDDLRRWVDDPQKVKPGCLMPAFGLGEPDRDKGKPGSRRPAPALGGRDRDLVLRYLLTLR